MLKKGILALSVAALSIASSHAAIVFTEGFDSLTDATPPTTSNTALTYVRISGGATPIFEAQNPAAVGSGSSLLMLATTASLTGIGATGFGAFTSGSFALDVRTPATQGAASTLFFGVGTGTTFTGNGTFGGNDLTAAIQIINGQIQTRTSANAWVNVGTALTNATNFSIKVFFNGAASPLDYGTGTAAAGTADVFVNGSLVGDDVSIRNAVSATAFRIYTVSQTAANPFEIDNVLVESLPIPEPSTALSVAGGIALLCGLRRVRGTRLS